MKSDFPSILPLFTTYLNDRGNLQQQSKQRSLDFPHPGHLFLPIRLDVVELVTAIMLHHLFFMRKTDSRFSAFLFFRVQVSEELLHPHLITPRLGAKQTKKCLVSEKLIAVCCVIRFPTASGSVCDCVGDVGKCVRVFLGSKLPCEHVVYI